MKITHIGTADNSGGAARAAFHLHEALLSLGHKSRMVVGQKFESRPEIDRIGFSRTLHGRILNRLVLEVETRTGLQYLIQPNRYKFLSHPFVQEADIIHLHNLHGNFFAFTILPRLSRVAPIVWTLHDTWALTGHCSYNYDCGRWEKGCGKCPNLGEYPKIAVDTTALLWGIKRWVYRRTDMHIVAPSRWLAEMARRSPLCEGCEIHRIPYGIDTDAFRPLDRHAARKRLGIPADAKVVMTLAFEGDERKGFEYFWQAVQRLQHNGLLWVLVVGGRRLPPSVPRNFRLLEIGYVGSTEFMNVCYCSADILVLPTLADNLPLSLLESFSAGTPSVAFDAGGVPDVIQHMETGYLSRYKDPEDLARGMGVLLRNDDLRVRMQERCREIAVREYARPIQARRYVEIYERATSGRKTLEAGMWVNR